MNALTIVDRNISDLKTRATNPRTHSKRQLEQIAASITKFGFTNPVLIDDDDVLIAGHGRVAAAQMIGMSAVPSIRLRSMSKASIRAYVIADNAIATKAGWDKELLAIEFNYLSELEEDFDPSVTGFEIAEIEALTIGDTLNDAKPDKADRVPPISEEAPVTQPGDIWEMGDHRLICGDSTKFETFENLLGDDRAHMVFSDCPWNVPINGHVSGLGGIQHREFAMASGEMSKDEFTSFLARTLTNQAKASVDGSIHFQCIDWRHVGQMIAAGEVAYHELKSVCVWDKGVGGMGSLYRSAHELVLVFKRGTAPHTNNVELGKNGRYRTNVWHHRGLNSFGANRTADLSMHPTVKPVALIVDAILDCSNRKDIVLDAFAGSGSTLVAAHKTKRRGYGIEIDQIYCDTIVKRMRTLFKLEATLAGDDRTFDEIAMARRDDPAQEVAA